MVQPYSFVCEQFIYSAYSAAGKYVCGPIQSHFERFALKGTVS